MFQITRLAAASATAERKVAKAVTNYAKAHNQDVKKTFNGFKLGTEPTPKNIFKRMNLWIKTFKENYNIIKNHLKDDMSRIKDNYGELFTKKRQRIVKQTLFKRYKADVQNSFNNFMEKLNKRK